MQHRLKRARHDCKARQKINAEQWGFRDEEASIAKSNTRSSFLIVQSKYTGLTVVLREVLQLELSLDHPNLLYICPRLLKTWLPTA